MENMYHCDQVKAGPGGAFQGHMLPGVLFVVWSLHWLQGTMRHWLTCKSSSVPYYSLPYYSWPRLPAWPIESFVKIVMSGMGAVLEVTWHDDGFQNLVCKPGTLRAGHFDGDHINNWQHVQMYACFMVSGAVDIAGYFGVLPPGTEKAFLSLAFAGEAVLMGLHEKSEPLDRFLHQMLAVAMVACCLACASEVAWPQAYLASCARVAFVMLQGVLFIVIAKTRFEYHTAWDITDGDTAPYQYSKVIVAQTIVTILVVYAALQIAVQACQQKRRS